MIRKSIHPLTFSLMIASSVIALSSSSHAMDPAQAEQVITKDIATYVQELKALEAQLQERQADYEAALAQSLTWNGGNDTPEEASAKKEDLNENQEFYKGLIKVTEGDIKTQKALLRKQQIQQLKLAKKAFVKASHFTESDSWEGNRSKLPQLFRDVEFGTELMHEVESSLSNDSEVEEMLTSVKYVYNDVAGLPEYLSNIFEHIDTLKRFEQNLREVMAQLENIDSSEDREKIFNEVDGCQIGWTKLMKELETGFFTHNNWIKARLAPLEDLQKGLTAMYNKKISLYSPSLSTLPSTPQHKEKLELIGKLALAKQKFEEAMTALQNLDSANNKKELFRRIIACQMTGKKFMEEIQSSASMNDDDDQITEGLAFLKSQDAKLTAIYDAKFLLYYSSISALPPTSTLETEKDLDQQLGKLEQVEKFFNSVFPLFRDFGSSQDDSDILQTALKCVTRGTELMQEVEATSWMQDSQIQQKIHSLRCLEKDVEGTCRYRNLQSKNVVASTPLSGVKIEEEEKPVVAIVSQIPTIAAPMPEEATPVVVAEPQIPTIAAPMPEEATPVVVAEPQIPTIAAPMPEEATPVVVAELQMPTIAAPKLEETIPAVITTPAPKPEEVIAAVVTVSASKPEETIPVVITASTPVVRPTLEKGPPPPPGPLVRGQTKGEVKRPATDNSEVDNPQTPKGPENPNPKAPPAGLMEQLREVQQRREEKQKGENASGKTFIPQIQKDVPQIEKPKAVFSLKKLKKNDEKGGNNIPTSSSQSAAPQDDLSKVLSPTELDVQALELRLAALPDITAFANLELQDKATKEQEHNAKKTAINEKLKVALKTVMKEKADALKKLQGALRALSKGESVELLPDEKMKKQKHRERVHQRQALSEKVEITKIEYKESFEKKIDHKIQFLTWKNEESLRNRQINKDSSTNLKKTLADREQELQKKRDDYKSQMLNIGQLRAAGQKVHVLQPLHIKAGELQTEIEDLEKLQKVDGGDNRELKRRIKVSKDEVKENTKKIEVLKTKRGNGPPKEEEENAVPDVLSTLSQSLASQNVQGFAEERMSFVELNAQNSLDASLKFQQDFDYDVVRIELTPEQKAARAALVAQEAEERKKRIAENNAAAAESAEYKAKEEAHNRAMKTDQQSLAQQRDEKEKETGVSLIPKGGPLYHDDEVDSWSD